MIRRLTVLLAFSAALVACGGGDKISDTATKSLGPRIAAVRAAAESGRPDVATAEIAAIRTDVEALRAAGDLTDSGARRIVEAADAVEAQLPLITTTTTAPPPPPSTSPPPPDDGDEDDKGRGKGEGKGDGKDD